MKQVSIFFGLGAAAMLSGCGVKSAPREAGDGDRGTIRAVVSVPPQAEFVRRVGGDHVEVEVLVGDGQDPHTFSPTPSQMTALGRADVLFTVGMPFEQTLVEKIAEAGSGPKVVDTGAGFEKIALQCDHPSHAAGGEGHAEEHGHADGHGHEEGHEDGHDDGHDHEHHEPDPHIWLAPNLIKVQAGHIEAALAEAAPEHAAEFQQNRAALDAELDELHAALSEQMDPHIGERFYVFHPAFGYFGHTYGIDQVAVEVNGNSPTPKELSDFIAMAKGEGVKVLFTQPQFDPRAAETVAEALGAQVVPLDPLAPDVLANLRRIADAIAAGFSS